MTADLPGLDDPGTSAPDLVHAPWDIFQVASLNGYQHARVFHAFTCGNEQCPGLPQGKQSLVAAPAGWRCSASGCGYTQDWAHAWMANWGWKRHEDQVKVVFGEAGPAVTVRPVVLTSHRTPLTAVKSAIVAELGRVEAYPDDDAWHTAIAAAALAASRIRDEDDGICKLPGCPNYGGAWHGCPPPAGFGSPS